MTKPHNALDGYVTRSRAEGRCRSVCPAGQRCALSTHQHKLHFCETPGCDCREAMRPPEPVRRYVVATRVDRVAAQQGGRLDLWALVMRGGGKRAKVSA